MQSIKFNKCYIIRHAERFDFKYPFNWLIKCILSNINPNDTPITEKGYNDAYMLGRSIYIDDNFIPDVIYSSPYLRCKQTAIAIQYFYKQLGYDINIITDSLLEEIKYNEIKNDQLNDRINNIYKKLINSGKYQNIILITHAVIVYNLSNIYQKTHKIELLPIYRLKYLAKCIFDKNGYIYKFF